MDKFEVKTLETDITRAEGSDSDLDNDIIEQLEQRLSKAEEYTR